MDGLPKKRMGELIGDWCFPHTSKFPPLRPWSRPVAVALLDAVQSGKDSSPWIGRHTPQTVRKPPVPHLVAVADRILQVTQKVGLKQDIGYLGTYLIQDVLSMIFTANNTSFYPFSASSIDSKQYINNYSSFVRLMRHNL